MTSPGGALKSEGGSASEIQVGGKRGWAAGGAPGILLRRPVLLPGGVCPWNGAGCFQGLKQFHVHGHGVYHMWNRGRGRLWIMPIVRIVGHVSIWCQQVSNCQLGGEGAGALCPVLGCGWTAPAPWWVPVSVSRILFSVNRTIGAGRGQKAHSGECASSPGECVSSVYHLKMASDLGECVMCVIFCRSLSFI